MRAREKEIATESKREGGKEKERERENNRDRYAHTYGIDVI